MCRFIKDLLVIALALGFYYTVTLYDIIRLRLSRSLGSSELRKNSE